MIVGESRRCNKISVHNATPWKRPQIELNLWPAHFFRHGLDLSVWILDPVGRDSVVQLVVVSCISE